MDPAGDLQIEVLGPVRIARTADLGPKQQLLLGALALRRRPVSTDELTELLWRDGARVDRRSALQVHVSKLRGALAQVGVSIDRDTGGYRLGVGGDGIDVTRFEQLAEAGTTLVPHAPGAAATQLASALDLWRGEPLGGLADATSLDGDIARLVDLHLSVIHARIEADLALGRHDAAIADLRRLTTEHPLHEGFWRQLLLALGRSGRSGEALERYDAARRHIRAELGSEPGPALREVHRQLLDQDPAVLRPPATPPHRSAPAPRPVTPDSVAVLPFEVIGDAEGVELLAHGLHMDLLTELSRVPRLTTIGRHSVLGYAGSSTSLEEMGAQLGAAMIVTGSVQVDRGRFRLTVHLVEAATGRQRWAESYDHQLTAHSVLGVQRDLAHDIATSLAKRALPQQAPPTTSMEAYRLVIEGRMQFDRKTEESLRAAVPCFEQAVLADPGYGAAWVGLADALSMSADYSYGDRDHLVASAEAALTRALAASADPGMVHTSRGLLAEARCDAGRALVEYELAIQEAPGHADAHSWHAWLSLTTGHAAQALRSARRSVELNPLSAEAVTNLALALLGTRAPAEALTEARRAAALSPTYTTAPYYEGLALYDLRRAEDAVEVLTPLATTAAGELSTPWAGMAPDAALVAAHAAAGDIAAAERALTRIDPDSHPFEAGVAHLALGRPHQARPLLAIDQPLGYGECLLLHHHLRDVWARLDDAPLQRQLLRRAARSWRVEPVADAVE